MIDLTTEHGLVDALAADLEVALRTRAHTVEEAHAAALDYFSRPDHIAVEVTAGLEDESAPERRSLSARMSPRPNTAWGAVLLERHRAG